MDTNNGFEIVDKKMTTLVPKQEISGGGMLANVAPPSALPSFISAPSAEISSSKVSERTFAQSISTQSKMPEHSLSAVVTQPTQPVVLSSPSDCSAKAATVAATEGAEAESGSWLGWFKGRVGTVGQRVAEGARNSMDTMITALDPQMKEFINSGGDIDVVVASASPAKVCAVREAMQKTFGKATVSSYESEEASSTCTVQLVGFEAAAQAAASRIDALRNSRKFHPEQPVVAIEGFIVELVPQYWTEMSVLLLDDPSNDVLLQTFTQPTPVPSAVLSALQQTADANGFSMTVGAAAATTLKVDSSSWQEAASGVSRRDSLFLAARSLSHLYRAALPQDII